MLPLMSFALANAELMSTRLALEACTGDRTRVQRILRQTQTQQDLCGGPEEPQGSKNRALEGSGPSSSLSCLGARVQAYLGAQGEREQYGSSRHCSQRDRGPPGQPRGGVHMVQELRRGEWRGKVFESGYLCSQTSLLAKGHGTGIVSVLLLLYLGPQLYGAEHHHHCLQAAVGLRPVQHEGRRGSRQVHAARRRDAPQESTISWRQCRLLMQRF